MKFNNRLIFIFLVIFLYSGLSYLNTGGSMNTKNKGLLYKTLLETEKEKKWLMLTDDIQRRGHKSYMQLFQLCSLNLKHNKNIDISLYSAEEWPSKNLGSYALSPDASKIAFTIGYFDYSTGQNLDALYIMHVQDGKFDTILPPKRFPTIGSLSWSPDGKKICFVGKLEEIKEPLNTAIPQFNSLYSLNLETMNIDMLVQYDVFDTSSQSLSPDASEVVFGTSKRQIYIYNFKSKITRQLTDGMWPTWHPIDNTIAFFGPDENYYFINSDGSNKHLFIKNEYKGSISIQTNKKGETIKESIGKILGYLLWSPDGQYVYLEKTATHSRFDDVEHYIPYIMDVDTKEEIRLPDDFPAGIKSWVGNK